jgi:hypothetical protein
VIREKRVAMSPKTVLITALGILFAMSACQNPYDPECVSRSMGSEEMVQLDSMVTLFADTRSDVESKPATDIEATIQGLREIRLEAENIEVERCLAPYQQDILTYMDLKIEAFVTVSLGESKKVVSEAFEASDRAYREYLEERNWLANTVAD